VQNREFVTVGRAQRIGGIVAAALGALALAILIFRPGDRGSIGTDLADPFGWIEHGLEGELLQVNNATGEIIQRLAVGEPGDDFSAVAHGDGALVWNRRSAALRLVDPIAASLSAPIAMELDPAQDPMSVQVFGGDRYDDDVIVLGDDRVVSIDPESGVSTPVFTPSGSRSAVVDATGRFVDLAPDGDQIRSLTTDGLIPIGAVPPPVPGIETPPTLVEASERLFTVDPARLAVRELLPDGTAAPANCMTSPGTLAAGSADGPGSVPRIVALDPDSAVVSVSEPLSASCYQLDLRTGSSEYGVPVVLDGIAYLPNFGRGRIEVLDLAERSIVRNVTFATSPGQPFELEVFGRVVWANERQGPLAGIVSADGLRPIPKIESVRVAFPSAGDDGDGPSPFAIATPDGGADGQTVGGDEPGSADADADQTDAPVVDTEVLGVDVEVEVEAEEEPAVAVPNEAALLANFRVSSSTAGVGESVRFVDASVGDPVAWIWDFGDGGGGDGPEIDHSWAEEGVYRVELTVFDADGNESSQATEIVIIGDDVALPPVADFTFDRGTIEEGESVAFTSRTTGEATSLVWDFGDGTGADGDAAVHRFDRAGAYRVTLTATNEAGSTSASVTITVVRAVVAPVASIGRVAATTVEVGQTLTFTSTSSNDPTALQWDFGDGVRVSGASVRHTWSAPGVYRVRLTASNTAGSDDAAIDITVEPALEPPIARLAQSATEVVAGDPIRFSSLSVNEPSRLVWNFGDGSTARGTEVTHRWEEAGTYEVTLRAINAAGDDRVSTTVVIREPVAPPVAGFGLDRSEAGIGEAIQFTDASTPAATEWLWDFGDGTTSTSRNPSHSWAAAGTYIVKVTASNEGGQSSAQLPVTIFAEPIARFDWTVDGTRVAFQDRSSSQPNEWLWDFGDGDRSRQQNPTHRFDPGEYTVTLIAANNVGPSEPVTATIVVVEPPDARFSCRADNFRLNCDGSGSDGADRYQWFADDAIWTSGLDTATPTFIFADDGRYEVTLRVTNRAGESDDRTKLTTRVDGGAPPEIRRVDIEQNRNGTVELLARIRNSPNSWNWNVEGGELIAGGGGQQATFQFRRNGVYTGTVQASNELGSSEVVEFQIEVTDLGPRIDFRWQESDEPGVIFFEATFDVIGTPTVDWNFDGGEIIGGSIEAPIVFFPEDRRYRVELTVTDDNGTASVSDRVRWDD
jgi:PKD repeat protein